jgi:hypothetical protein
MVPTLPFAPQGLVCFPETPAGVLVDERIYCLNDFGIPLINFGSLVVGRPRQFDATATSLYGQLMF